MRLALLPLLLAALAIAQTPNHAVTVPSFQGVKPVLTVMPPPPKGPGTDTYQVACKSAAMTNEAVAFYQAEMKKQGFIVLDTQNNERFTVVTMTKDSKNLVVTLNAYKIGPQPALTIGVLLKGRL
jgi:hypothetical protein